MLLFIYTFHWIFQTSAISTGKAKTPTTKIPVTTTVSATNNVTQSVPSITSLISSAGISTSIKHTTSLTPQKPTLSSSHVAMTTLAQKGGDSGKSYDRELVIIFGVMLGLMLIVIVIFGIHKCRKRNKSSTELPMTLNDKYRNGGGDVSIAASTF